MEVEEFSAECPAAEFQFQLCVVCEMRELRPRVASSVRVLECFFSWFVFFVFAALCSGLKLNRFSQKKQTANRERATSTKSRNETAGHNKRERKLTERHGVPGSSG